MTSGITAVTSRRIGVNGGRDTVGRRITVPVGPRKRGITAVWRRRTGDNGPHRTEETGDNGRGQTEETGDNGSQPSAQTGSGSSPRRRWPMMSVIWWKESRFSTKSSWPGGPSVLHLLSIQMARRVGRGGQTRQNLAGSPKKSVARV
jgi:hypothetical protein